MQRFFRDLKQGLYKTILLFGLAVLVSISGLFIFFAQPSYAVPQSKNQLTPDEKVDRAYSLSEATGFLEEDKQNSENADELFDYNKKANSKSLKGSQHEKSDSNLIEKAQGLIDKLKDQD